MIIEKNDNSVKGNYARQGVKFPNDYSLSVMVKTGGYRKNIYIFVIFDELKRQQR
jgi:hypothetical protein